MTSVVLDRTDATASPAPVWSGRRTAAFSYDPPLIIELLLVIEPSRASFPVTLEKSAQGYLAVDRLTDQSGSGPDGAAAATDLVSSLRSYYHDLRAHAGKLTPRLARHLRILEQAFHQ